MFCGLRVLPRANTFSAVKGTAHAMARDQTLGAKIFENFCAFAVFLDHSTVFASPKFEHSGLATAFMDKKHGLRTTFHVLGRFSRITFFCLKNFIIFHLRID